MSRDTFRLMLERALRPLKNRIMLTVSRGVLDAVNDATGLQLVKLKLLAGEVGSDIERVQEYGFTSVPFPDAEAAALFVSGNREHGLVVGIDDRRYRLKGLASGEVALYTDEGDKIHFKRGRVIDIVTDTLNISASTKVSIDSPLVETTGKITAVGNIESAATVKASVNVEAAVTVKATVSVDTPAITFTGGSGIGTGNFSLTGNFDATQVSDSVGSLSGFRSNYNSHTHVAPGGGGTTSGPSPTDP